LSELPFFVVISTTQGLSAPGYKDNQDKLLRHIISLDVGIKIAI